MLENNGYQIFNQYPILLNASYVMLKYSFPDLTASAFGDTEDRAKAWSAWRVLF